MAMRDWTFLVYLAGDNNLEAAAEADLVEMKAVGTTERVAVVAQVDRGTTNQSTRYELHIGTTLSADAVEQLGTTNTGDPNTLIEFVDWAAQRYPAKRYALVLWNHGAGWKDDDIYRAADRAGVSRSLVARRHRGASTKPVLSRALFHSTIERAVNAADNAPLETRAVLFDDTAKDFLDNLELSNVVGAITRILGKPLDLLGFDACMMAMPEVAMQMMGDVAVIVGSQEIEPNEGWPYTPILEGLNAKASLGPEPLGRLIVDCYRRFWSGRDTNGVFPTQSALSLNRMQPLIAAIDDFAKELLAACADSEVLVKVILPSLRGLRTADDNQYADLGDLASRIASRGEGPLAQAATGVIRAMVPGAKKPILARWGLKGQPASGLGIYLPRLSAVSPLYAGLRFSDATHWDEFLEAFNLT